MTFTYELPPLLKQMKELGKKTTKIYFGYPSGNPQADKARLLSYDNDMPFVYEMKNDRTALNERGDKVHYKAGETFLVQGWPGRPFLTDGYMAYSSQIDKEIEAYWKNYFIRGVSSPDLIGRKIVNSIRDYVKSNPYEETLPNSSVIAADKGDNHPLVRTGKMMNALEFVVTNRLE